MFDIAGVNSVDEEMTLATKPKSMKIIAPVPMVIMKLFNVAFAEFASIIRPGTLLHFDVKLLPRFGVFNSKIIFAEPFTNRLPAIR